jgi:hypothetical protein
MCEPLRGKKYRIYGNGEEGSKGLKDGNLLDVDDVKSAVEFYKKYRYGTEYSLEKEHPEIWKEYLKYRKEHGIVSNAVNDDWLFDYCFGDVINGS